MAQDKKRFNDLNKSPQQGTGFGFFSSPLSGPPLSPQEVPEYVTKAAAKYSCDQTETKWLIGFVQAVLPNPHPNQIRGIVELSQKGLKVTLDNQRVQTSTPKKT